MHMRSAVSMESRDYCNRGRQPSHPGISWRLLSRFAVFAIINLLGNPGFSATIPVPMHDVTYTVTLNSIVPNALPLGSGASATLTFTIVPDDATKYVPKVYSIFVNGTEFDCTESFQGSGVYTIPLVEGSSCVNNPNCIELMSPANPPAGNIYSVYVKVDNSESSVSQVTVFDFVGTMTPDDNFAERNQDKYGIAETVTLGVTITPSALNAADVGGLQWQNQTGDVGTLPVANTDGTGSYNAGPTPGDVTLQLRWLPGGSSGVMKSYPKTVTAPTGNYQSLITWTTIGHVINTVSVGFETNFYILPTDVSFKKIMVREGSGAAGTGSGIYAAGSPPHGQGSFGPVSNCNVITGCQWQYLGNTGPRTDYVGMCPLNPVPNNYGVFNLPVPDDYQVGTTVVLAYQTVVHNVTTNQAGLDCLSKAGVGPYCKAVTDASAQTDIFSSQCN